jgi:redox-sensitive bicupin YhaK (pirin superfamily)
MLSRRRFLAGTAASSALLGCQAVTTSKTASPRAVTGVIPAAAGRDGAGVALRRSLGGNQLPLLDPFLLLDEIHSGDPADYVAGFPRHPHRGFETVSYVLRGAFEHRDNVGNHGTIADGGAQWMTAGHGILHSEMPVGTRDAEVWGLQLWVNLPAARKLIRPRYQDLAATAIPELDVADARVRLVAGQLGAARGPVDGIDIRPTMLDATLAPRATFQHDLPGGDTAFAYVLTGAISIGGLRVDAGELAILGPGSRVLARSDGGGRFLLVSGTPLREPVARRGPFVMTTDAELDQAFADYQSGRLTDG